MEIAHTLDKHGRTASYGIENGIPWLEYREGQLGRTLLSGSWERGHHRMAEEIRRRGISVTKEFSAILDSVALA